MLPRLYDYLIRNQVIFALCLIFFGWFIYSIHGIILSLFLSYIIMAAILPITKYLRSKRVPKLLAVLIPYFAILLLLVILIFPLVPFVVQQLQSLIVGFPKYLNDSAALLGIKIDFNQLQTYVNSQMATISSNAVQVTTTVFGGLFTVITVFIVSLYLLLYNDLFKKNFSRLFPRSQQDRVLTTLGLINEKLGAWLQGQIILSVTIGCVTWIALTLLGIPFALPLAILAGMLEVIPTLGPTLSAIPAVIVALTISPTMALAIVATYILIQMLENQLLVPKIMERAVGLNPIVVILGVSIGANLMGIVGALLSIPFISFIIVIYKSLQTQK
jgi:predicted PurR-regulated permease PerM